MKQDNFLSALLIPLFYFLVGLIFVFAPEIPSQDLKIPLNHLQVPLLFTQEIGVLFIVFTVLLRQLYNKSREVYLEMNSTLIFVLVLISLIEPYLYTQMPNHAAPQLLVILGINLFFIILLFFEKKKV